MDIRQRIIETAYNQFYQQGFHACGVELLAQEAGTTKRTLYAHFGSKEGLIEAVLQYRHNQFIENMQAALNKRPERETATAYLDFIKAWCTSQHFYGCLFINASAEFSDGESMPHRHAAAHKQQIREILQNRLQTAGATDAKEQADFVFLCGEGLIVAAQTGQLDLFNTIKINHLLD
ncbi:MAG: TetR/AcrR family transcriptional regulator [Neisseria sp.]|uniref:TetR/AcrR family transcriptional regulator n=1 Tax=Neisseria sp. TaxID=192066 RepID=UPI0026DC2758|nr:TetR/AcrR family transcriptional regulator [Neisseria sp.]MDO4642068.1 TetR/AcrR family transcriptional regulator [Neisseria sp.]